MIAKIFLGSSLEAALRYALNERLQGHSNPRIMGGTMAGFTIAQLTHEWAVVQQLHDDLRKSSFQCSLRLEKGDSLTEDEWIRLAHTFMRRMGYEQSQYVIICHADDHIHIVASRVLATGQVVPDSFDQPRAMATVHELETAFQLSHSVDPVIQSDRDRQLESKIARAVDDCNGSLDDFCRVLKLHRVAAILCMRGDTNIGIRYIDEDTGHSRKGSKLSACSLPKLLLRLEQRRELVEQAIRSSEDIDKELARANVNCGTTPPAVTEIQPAHQVIAELPAPIPSTSSGREVRGYELYASTLPAEQTQPSAAKSHSPDGEPTKDPTPIVEEPSGPMTAQQEQDTMLTDTVRTEKKRQRDLYLAALARSPGDTPEARDLAVARGWLAMNMPPSTVRRIVGEESALGQSEQGAYSSRITFAALYDHLGDWPADKQCRTARDRLTLVTTRLLDQDIPTGQIVTILSAGRDVHAAPDLQQWVTNIIDRRTEHLDDHGTRPESGVTVDPSVTITSPTPPQRPRGFSRGD